MVQKPTNRRSKSTRKPVTIDLTADEVKETAKSQTKPAAATPIPMTTAAAARGKDSQSRPNDRTLPREPLATPQCPPLPTVTILNTLVPYKSLYIQRVRL